jgi:CRISPR-associated protein Cas2
MARRHYLVSYDVSDDKRRDRVFEALKDHGNHTQFSVFLCELSPREAASLRGLLSGIIHHGQDQVLLVDLGVADHELAETIEAIGRPFSAPVNAHII